MNRRDIAVIAAIAVPALLLSSGSAWQVICTRAEAGRFPAPGRMVDVGGHSLHLLCTGSGAPTVILEGSGLGGVLQYAEVQRALARRVRVCSYDRAGLGWSEPAPGPADARRLSGDLERLLEGGQVAPPYLMVASSAGGLTVELYAREHPARVSGLVMLDALNGNIVRQLAQLDALRSIACSARVGSWFGLTRLLDPLQLRRLPESERARAIAFTYRTQTLAAVCSQTSWFAQSAAEIEGAPALPRELPVVVITHDDFEGMIPGASREQLSALEPRWQALQREFADGFNAGEFQSTHSRHLIASARPDVVIEAVRRLLDGYPAAGSP